MLLTQKRNNNIEREREKKHSIKCSQLKYIA